MNSYPGIPDVINGNGAVAHVMKQVCGGVIGYPITPSTEISEIFEAGRAEGQLNIWGKHPFFVEAEGEHSAQSGALGAAMTGGNFISNASSSQGILYALESHYVTTGKKIGGFVMHVAARVVTRHSLNVMAGHDDIYSLLPAGYTILFGSNPQEATDLAAIAYRATSLSLVPVANAMDGFATSHVMSEVLLPEPDLLKTYLGDPAGRIQCPTLAQELLFGAKGRVDSLTKWISKHKADLGADTVAELTGYLDTHADRIETDNDGTLVPEVAGRLPEALRAQFRRAWKGAWTKGTRQLVPGLVDPNNPGLIGGVQNQPDFQAGSADHRTHFVAAVPGLVRQAMKEYSDLTGRIYTPVTRYGAEDADVVVVGLGSITDDARALLPYLETQGIKAAVVSVKLLQPFPTEELVAALKGAKRVTVMERSEDTALVRAVKQSLFEAGVSAADLPITTAIFGLGSHDVQPRDLIAVFKAMTEPQKSPLVYVGSQFFVKNPASPTLAAIQDRLRAAYPETEAMALEVEENPPGLLPPEALRIRFHSVGGYGTVATGKLLTDMLSSMLHMHSKSSPKYGSEKSGAATNFYLTLSPEDVLFTNASLEDVEVVVSPDHKVFEHDRPLRGLVEGGTFILQSDKTPEEVWHSLPAYARAEIIAKNIKFLVIDAFAVAKKHAPTANLETRMMGIAFIGAIIGHVPAISGGADQEQVKELVQHEIHKKFGPKGIKVVEANMAVVHDGIDAAQPVDYAPYADDTHADAPKTPVLSPRLTPVTSQSAPSALYDPAYFDDILGRPFREGWADQAPVVPGSGLFIPRATGANKNKGIFRLQVPAYDETKCTACLECALACPDSAIPNTAHEIVDVLARAIRVSSLCDDHKTSLLGLVPQWADKVRAALLDNPKAKDFAEVVRATAGIVPDLASEHLDAIVASVKAFPVARIRPIFDVPEKKEPGTGALYSVVIDPWKCTGCLQCVDVCGPGALSPVVQDDDLKVSLETSFEALTQLPNTPARFTANATAPGGDAKRLLLDHTNYYALAGGHGACKGCGEVTSTHLVTALSQALGEEKRVRHIAEVTALIDQLTAKAATVEDERRARIEATIDTLESRLYLYESGPTTQGPASMVIVNSTGCSSVYGSSMPSNPFTQPWLNSLFQDAQASAVGVFEGLASQYVAEVQAKRIAELELADAYTDEAGRELTTLSWHDFTVEEFEVLPVILTISGDGAAFDIGFGAMSRVLASATPIKMMVLDTGGYSNTGGQASTASLTGQNSDLARHGKAHAGKTEKRKELALLAAMHPDVFVATASTALHSHFLATTARVLAYPHGSALLQVYTPCGFEQGFADDLSNARAKLAVRSRVAPLFVHDPLAGNTLPERISLDGNPEIDKKWATRTLRYTDESGKTAVVTTELTPAEFAYGEVRFAKQFRVLAADAPNPTPIAEYVELSYEARNGRTPYILTEDNGALIKIQASSAIVELVEDRQYNWQLLRFLAGRDAELSAKDAQKALDALQEEVASAQQAREDGIDQIAKALAALATAKDPSTVAIPSFGGGVPASSGSAISAPPAPGDAPSPAASRPGLGPVPAGSPIWLSDADIAKCTDCATCYQELSTIFEQTTIVVDGEAKNVSHMKPGSLTDLTLTPELVAVMQRVKDTCDAEIIQ